MAAKAAGAGGPDGTGLVVLRADSAFYNHDVIATARRAGVRFSITARMNLTVTSAIANIDQAAWTPISYPNAVWDADEQRLISDAEIAEVPFTAFTSRRKSEHIPARLIVRRVKRLTPKAPATPRAPTPLPASSRSSHLQIAPLLRHAVADQTQLPKIMNTQGVGKGR